jgi:hypothetical protein
MMQGCPMGYYTDGNANKDFVYTNGTADSQSMYDMEALPGGGFTVLFANANLGLYANTFDNSGGSVSGAFYINNDEKDEALVVGVTNTTTVGEEDMAVVWTADNSGSSVPGVMHREEWETTGTETVGDTTLTGGSGSYSIQGTSLSNGGFATIWSEGNDKLQAHFIDTSGNTLSTNPFDIVGDPSTYYGGKSVQSHSVDTLDNGDLIISARVYETVGPDVPTAPVVNRVNIYRHDGESAVEATKVGQIALADPGDLIVYADVAALNTGGYAVAYEYNVGGDTNIRYQLYDVDNQPLGGEVAVTALIGGQISTYPVVVGLANDGWAVGWYDHTSKEFYFQAYRVDGSEVFFKPRVDTV